LSVKAGEIASGLVQRHSYFNFARGQLEKLIGGFQRGYVVGVGSNSPRRPYHRGRYNSAALHCNLWKTKPFITLTVLCRNVLRVCAAHLPNL